MTEQEKQTKILVEISNQLLEMTDKIERNRFANYNNSKNTLAILKHLKLEKEVNDLIN